MSRVSRAVLLAGVIFSSLAWAQAEGEQLYFTYQDGNTWFVSAVTRFDRPRIDYDQNRGDALRAMRSLQQPFIQWALEQHEKEFTDSSAGFSITWKPRGDADGEFQSERLRFIKQLRDNGATVHVMR